VLESGGGNGAGNEGGCREERAEAVVEKSGRRQGIHGREAAARQLRLSMHACKGAGEREIEVWR
jgi:hypothetical protein